MSATATDRVTSADGTTIVFDRSGTGPGIILVHGAFTDRAHPILSSVAVALAPWFTVFNYDRRGRGESQDTQPYAVERETEDLAALVEAAGGSAMVFGGSSGANATYRKLILFARCVAAGAWRPTGMIMACDAEC